MSGQACLKRRFKRQLIIFLLSALFVAGACILLATTSYAAGVSIDFLTDDTDGTSMGVLDLMLLFVVIALIPSILLMMTSFTRLIIVLSLLRNAMGTAQSPPNQVLAGLAIFLTLFIMQPTLTEINETAYQPYRAGEFTALEAVEAGQLPLKRFMLSQTTPKSLNLFLNISESAIPQVEPDADLDALANQLGLSVLVPAFITSELERAFTIGFLIYLPFLVVDVVVSSVLMSMGMMMLPPATISMPFKLLMFILVDGWSLIMGTLVRGFG